MKTPDQSIIEKTFNNESTPEEAREVVRWLSTREGQSFLATRMDADERMIGEGKEEEFIDHPIPSVLMLDTILQKVRRKKIRRLLFRAAALLIPFVLILGLFLEVNSRVDLFSTAIYDEVFVPKGEKMQILFQDGSRVYLNSESRIRYPRQFGLSERKVELEGEGWFDVSEMKNRPFIVDLKVINVRVLGTTFDVKAYPEESDISVSLETGSVELTGRTFKAFTIKPGEKAVYNRGSGKCSITRPSDIHIASAWKENMLVFSNAPLSEVITTLGRRFDVEFILTDEKASRYTYTLQTTHTDLFHVLNELEKIAPVRFEKGEKEIKVSLKE